MLQSKTNAWRAVLAFVAALAATNAVGASTDAATYLALFRFPKLLDNSQGPPEDPPLNRVEISHAQQCLDDVRAGKSFPESQDEEERPLPPPGLEPPIEATMLAEAVNRCLKARGFSDLFIVASAVRLGNPYLH